MRIFRDFCVSLIKIALPFFMMVNLYFCLLEIDPSLDFLGVGTPYTETLEYANALATCSAQDRQLVSYFGVNSLLNMFNDLPTDDTVNVLRSLFQSFLNANYMGPASVPSMSAIGQDWLRDMLKAFYQFFSILLQPVFALAWLVWAIIQFGKEIYDVLKILYHALAGYYNNWQCSVYPTVEQMEDILRTMSLIRL